MRMLLCLLMLLFPFAACAQELPASPLAHAQSTGMWVLAIETDDGLHPTIDDCPGVMRVYHPYGGSVRQDDLDIEINIRGNTSQRFPKKSFRVKLLDDRGDKMNFSLCGLRADDDWILNPMYTDTSKVREVLAYQLWDQMNSSGTRAASTRAAYAEVFLNGEYWGLYALQERIDRKQVNASKSTGVLYKVFANFRPTVEELLTCTDPEICQGVELVHAGENVLAPWAPAAAYMALLTGQENPVPAALSLPNAIDYGLWAMLTQAHDCHFKNQFLHAVYENGAYTLYKLPWDVNNTFGDIWQNIATDTNFTNYHAGDLVFDGVFERLVQAEDPQINRAISNRWQQLRQSVITEEQLIAHAHSLFDPLFDAIARDSLRWPQSGMGGGNARNIRDLEDYIRLIIPRMDVFVTQLLP